MFNYEGKVYKLVPDDRSKFDVCEDCAFKDNSDACAASYHKDQKNCVNTFSHYEEVKQ